MNMRAKRLAIAAAAVALLIPFAVTPVAAVGTSIIVSDLGDVAADDGDCTLREAIVAANTDTDSGATPGECPAGSATEPDEIGFIVAGTIVIGSDLPAITGDVRIAAASTITIDGAGSARQFTVTSGTVSIEDMTLLDGHASQGGAVSNDSTLTLAGIEIRNSTASEGGAILNTGTLEFVGSLHGNEAGSGGGIVNSGQLTISLSRIGTEGANTATSNGGGIFNNPGGTVTITSSVISGNTAAYSAGIENGGVMTIANSTIAGNEADQIGGGIVNVTREVPGTYLTLVNVTITGNSAGTDGGGLLAGTGAVVKNTIIAGNTAPSFPEVEGTIASETTSIVGVPAGKTLGGILDPAGLKDNGGYNETVALVMGAANPAINTGDNAVCAAPPVGGVDQRFEPRPANACDIGAYEAPAANPTQSDTSTNAGGGPTQPALDQGLVGLLALVLVLLLTLDSVMRRRARG